MKMKKERLRKNIKGELSTQITLILMASFIVEDPSQPKETVKKIACLECRRLHEEVRLHVDYSIFILISCNSARRTYRSLSVDVVSVSIEFASTTWARRDFLVAHSLIRHL